MRFSFFVAVGGGSDVKPAERPSTNALRMMPKTVGMICASGDVIEPCSGMTGELPARWWRPSTFCVTMPSRPAGSSAARARWPSFGSA